MKALTFILVFSLLFSCKNTKEIVKGDVEVKTATEQKLTKTQDAKANTETVKTIDEKISETDSTVIEETIVELSKPDSTGKQHPEKITTRVILSGKNKDIKTDTKEEVRNITENKVVETDEKDETQDIVDKTDTKTVEKSQSWKIISLLSLILIISGIVAYKYKGEAIKIFLRKFIK